MKIYTEAGMRAALDGVRARTQALSLRHRWAAHFTRIDQLPGTEGEPQRVPLRHAGAAVSVAPDPFAREEAHA
ncbi:hypothetical protein [Streptomyces sp. NBC_00582]|uniref:hypothetical protein n=1 Tax=Streptomyces sp. NBC_00582 TaxID=2975783 RepID=UPI001062B658|nr:hypothetical protein [Streptomyces sp. NBC_00582]WUB61906.1 hypothetical protein OG852_16650 [Streptomyces sp. NBC_00582]